MFTRRALLIAFTMLVALIQAAAAIAQDRAKVEIVPNNSHRGIVRTVAISPDGGRVVSAGEDDTLKLWDLASGQLIRTFVGHTPALDGIKSVAFSPDGARLLSGSDDNTMRLWDAASGQLIRTFEGHGGDVTSVAFSPDGARLLSGSHDSTMRLWDATSGQLIRIFFESRAEVDSVAFSPDGTRVLSGGKVRGKTIYDEWGADPHLRGALQTGHVGGIFARRLASALRRP
jgi:WD40 repeat protein